MQRIAIYGAGGFGKEVKGMLDEYSDRYSFAGYFDDYTNVPLVTEQQYDDVLIGIANPAIRSAIVNSWKRKSVPFIPLTSLDNRIHKSVAIGRGSIICAGVKFTVDSKVGDFSIINLNATVGHDVTIGEFCSIMPSVNISGNVTLGNRVFIGSGATVLQGIHIGDDAIIGAGSLVLKDVPAGQTVMGVPAKPKSF